MCPQQFGSEMFTRTLTRAKDELALLLYGFRTSSEKPEMVRIQEITDPVNGRRFQTNTGSEPDLFHFFSLNRVLRNSSLNSDQRFLVKNVHCSCPTIELLCLMDITVMKKP